MRWRQQIQWIGPYNNFLTSFLLSLICTDQLNWIYSLATASFPLLSYFIGRQSPVTLFLWRLNKRERVKGNVSRVLFTKICPVTANRRTKCHEMSCRTKSFSEQVFTACASLISLSTSRTRLCCLSVLVRLLKDNRLAATRVCSHPGPLSSFLPYFFWDGPEWATRSARNCSRLFVRPPNKYKG